MTRGAGTSTTPGAGTSTTPCAGTLTTRGAETSTTRGAGSGRPPSVVPDGCDDGVVLAASATASRAAHVAASHSSSPSVGSGGSKLPILALAGAAASIGLAEAWPAPSNELSPGLTGLRGFSRAIALARRASGRSVAAAAAVTAPVLSRRGTLVLGNAPSPPSMLVVVVCSVARVPSVLGLVGSPFSARLSSVPLSVLAPLVAPAVVAFVVVVVAFVEPAAAATLKCSISRCTPTNSAEGSVAPQTGHVTRPSAAEAGGGGGGGTAGGGGAARRARLRISSKASIGRQCKWLAGGHVLGRAGMRAGIGRACGGMSRWPASCSCMSMSCMSMSGS